MTVTFRPENNDQQWGGDVVVQTSRRWLRCAAYYGTPPGSHIGYWRTKVGAMRGWNVRIGRRYAGPCLTVFVHTRPQVSR